MRTNLPVSQTEYVLPPDLTLVSVTDLKGRITYCNAAFATASGYSQAELLGQPHNLVRHPDMPEEAFRDLWATIESGHPWQGVVKNRRKNGDHYWVMANATPMRDADRIVGYLSVRMAPSRAQIDACQALYARMQDEARGQRLRTGLRAGGVVRLDPVGRVAGALTSALGRWGLDGMAPLAAAAGTGLAASLAGPVVWVPAAIVLATGAWALVRWRRETALQSLLGDALRLAAGDLRQLRSAPQHGRMGELQLALSQIGLNLRTAIADVRSEVESVRGAAAEIASGNQDLSSRTEAQASSLEQTAASMEQINGTVRNTASFAEQGARMAAGTAEVATRSRNAVQGAVKAMQGISESSHRIGEIIQVIEGVSFQTNILALNAAVEAARAGEAGRGFAVVAAEVRALAKRTSDAAREIRQLIAEAADRVAGGVQQTDAAQAAMQEALQAVADVGRLLAQIDQASREQLLGVTQVNEAVSHMDGVTQQNAAMVEELAAAAQSLNGQVDVVTSAMRLFRLRDGDTTVAEVDAPALRREARDAALAA